jgi:hypothetical protein
VLAEVVRGAGGAAGATSKPIESPVDCAVPATAGAVATPWPESRPGGKAATSQRLLFHTSSSTDAPHRAVLPLVFAAVAKEKGHDPVVFLAGDATLLMKDTVAAGVTAVGQPSAAEVIRKAVELGIPIFL